MKLDKIMALIYGYSFFSLLGMSVVWLVTYELFPQVMEVTKVIAKVLLTTFAISCLYMFVAILRGK